MADVFVSYTSSDRDWAFWIGRELEGLGHTARVHEWEINAGGDILKWMEERLQSADFVLCIVSAVYLPKDYSGLERRAAQWAAQKRPNFLLPVFIEDCEPPLILAHLKRCNLFGISEEGRGRGLRHTWHPRGGQMGPCDFRAQCPRVLP